jgi:hypothetical protein
MKIMYVKASWEDKHVETEADFIACCEYIDILQKNMNTPCITTLKNTAPITTLHLPSPLSHEHKLVIACESDLLHGTQSANAPRKKKKKHTILSSRRAAKRSKTVSAISSRTRTVERPKREELALLSATQNSSVECTKLAFALENVSRTKKGGK